MFFLTMAPPSLLFTTERERVTTAEQIKRKLPNRDKPTLKNRIQNVNYTLQTPQKNVPRKKKKCWKNKADNTSTMSTARGKSQEKKATEQAKAASKQKPKEIQDDAIIDNSIITTDTNAKQYDIRGRMKIMGATEEQIEASTKPFSSAIGPGSMSDSIGSIIKSAAKVIRWKSRTPSAKELVDMVKIGLSPEEWLILSTALATQEEFDDRDIAKLLSYQEIIDLMIVLNRAAYTPPEVPCTKIKKNTSKATFTSSCWYGAQQALGSWYPNEKTKKKITPTIEAALQLAKVNKHTNASKLVTPRQDSKKRKKTTDKEGKSRKKASSEGTDSSENDEEMEVLSDSSDSVTHLKTVKGKKKTVDMDIDDEDDEEGQIGRASCRERLRTCRSRWSPYH